VPISFIGLFFLKNDTELAALLNMARMQFNTDKVTGLFTIRSSDVIFNFSFVIFNLSFVELLKNWRNYTATPA